MVARPQEAYAMTFVPHAPARDGSATHVVADQEEVFHFLGSPSTYVGSPAVERIDTHGAVVFLAGSDAYKVKRAVFFPYMDLSTLEKRRAVCESEVRVNAESAPGVYLGVVPIVRR